MDSAGEGMDVLRRTLAGYARHANFAGVLVIGLGCEANQMDALFFTAGPARRPAAARDDHPGQGRHGEGGRRGRRASCSEMLPVANEVVRETVPASHIMIGLQCGGSDGYSGITANPALGAAVDLLVQHGGTAILSETPEIYGAEHLLTRRAVSREVGREDRRSHPLVGGVHRAQPRRDEQQPLAGQQGGRAHHDPGEVPRRGGQGRHHGI